MTTSSTNLAPALEALLGASRIFSDPAARAVYEPLYREFARLYGRLRGTYARLNAGR